MTTSPPASCRFSRQIQESPLASFEVAYRQRLIQRGYAAGTQQQYLGCFAHFALWMRVFGISASEINSDLVARFTERHLPDCQCPGKVQRHTPQVRAALRQLIPVLLEVGFTKAVSMPDDVQVELDQFDIYMRDQRGLANNTRHQRRAIVGDLLRHTLDDNRPAVRVDAPMLRAFMRDRLERWSPSSAAVVAGALRAYLRYRALRGDEVAALLPVINSPACWKLTSLPETLSCKEIEHVLGSFSEPLPSWRRGAAVAQCVARLGLRSSEVVGLELEDLDWEVGTIRLRRCKSRREYVFPLPMTVGAAIAEYLSHERRNCASRRVFVRHVAPVEVPLQPSLVGRVIRSAYQRCGLPYTRVHIFRHSLAARVLDNGGTLKEVADVLRHRSLDTTQIYTKLDERRLTAVTMPWPGAMP